MRDPKQMNLFPKVLLSVAKQQLSLTCSQKFCYAGTNVNEFGMFPKVLLQGIYVMSDFNGKFSRKLWCCKVDFLKYEIRISSITNLLEPRTLKSYEI